MQRALKDKTNKKADLPMKRKVAMSDKEIVVTYLRDVTNKTKDHNLRYDISKCIEILEGKENQETLELKDVLEEVLLEKETLFREKCELAVELDLLRSREEDPHV